MPKITSTSSSSSERITDCAPVSCSGPMRFGLPFEDFAAGLVASVAMSAAAGVSGAGGLVGALTVVQSLFTLGVSRGNKKPPTAHLLHEGCALVLGCFKC